MLTSPVEGVVQHTSANPQALPLILLLHYRRLKALIVKVL